MAKRATVSAPASSRLYVKRAQRHFARERQTLNNRLRRSGFLRQEARDLSKLDKNDPVRMMEQRLSLLKQFDSRNRNLPDNKYRYEFHREVRDFYRQNKYLTDKDSRGLDTKGKPGGKPSHWEWFRNLESRFRAAVKKQKEAGRHVSLSPADMVRVEDAYPDGDIRNKRGKGQVKAQKSRARARGRAFKNHETAGQQARKVPLERLLAWRKDAFDLIKEKGESGRVQREWRSSLSKRINKAREEQAAGREAVA